MRPRERYALHGPDELGDAELLALVIGTGAAGRSALDIARAALARFGGLAGIANAPVPALALVPGIGPARAVRLHAALAAGRRAARATTPPEDAPVRNPEDAARWLGPALGGLAVEEFHALYLDHRLRPRFLRRLSRGTEARTLVDPRHVLGPAVASGTSAVVVAHNHPSGDPEPSADDLAATRRLVEAGRVLGVAVHDHLVFGAGGRWVSLAERGHVG